MGKGERRTTGEGELEACFMTSRPSRNRQPQEGTTAAHVRLGAQGEDVALALLLRAGYTLLDRNWRRGRLELDFVCRDGDTMVFVEVKTRSSAEFGGPAAGLTPAKRRTLCRAAQAWLATHQAWGFPCRFDVVCVLRREGVLCPEHYRHAFIYEPPVGGGSTPWQPW